MATYSLNLAKEYDAIAEIKDLKNYFKHCCTERDYEGIKKQLDGLIMKIKEAILDAVRIWANGMMEDNRAEFVI